MRYVKSVISFAMGLAMSATMAQSQEEKINVKEWAAASKLLADTAEIIKKNGWQQGATEAVPQDCFATAFEKAFRANPEYTLVDLNYARVIMDRVIGVKNDQIVAMSYNTNANTEHVPAVPYWGLAYMDWNDRTDQTVESVLKTIYEASSKAAELSKEAAAAQ